MNNTFQDLPKSTLEIYLDWENDVKRIRLHVANTLYTCKNTSKEPKQTLKRAIF